MNMPLKLLITCTAAMLMHITPALAQDSYTFAMLPAYAAERMVELSTPIAQRLEAELGKPVIIDYPHNFAEYIRRSNNGLYDITYSNPAVAVQLKAMKPIATAYSTNTNTSNRGLIIVSKDSQINSIDGLADKTIMRVSPNSARGYLSQMIMLHQQNFDISRIEFTSAARNRHANVIAAVACGDVEAGFIRESAMRSTNAFIPNTQVRILEVGAHVPNWILSTRSTLTKVDIQNIYTATTQLSEFELQTLRLTAFTELASEDWTKLHQFRELRNSINDATQF